MNLAELKCIPCHGGIPTLKGEELARYAEQESSWSVVAEHHITRSFSFPDFQQGLDFVNRVGAVAEREGHHPDLFLTWGRVDVTIYTHKVSGLTENDFILAAKIDREFPQ